MNRLIRLRAQMLIAMGLPACWTAAPPATTPPQQSPPLTIATDGSCRVDAVTETICGSVDAEKHSDSCGATGDDLESFGASKIYVSQHDMTSHQQRLQSWRLDPDETRAYQDSLKKDLNASWLQSYCCYSRCTSLHASGPVAAALPPDHHMEAVCIPTPKATDHPAPGNAACPAAIGLNGQQRNIARGAAGQCCYEYPVHNPVEQEQRHYRGRAARVDGVEQFPEVNAEASGRAAFWLEAAKQEHASIAAFANLSLRLLAHGAPPELVAGAHAAALDEIEHARFSFEQASRFAGEPLAPITFDGAAQMRADGSLAELARETFVDGCIGETVAAHIADVSADAERDPVIADGLRKIADDETRHAQLAWAIVKWCVAREPALLPELRALASHAPDDIRREVVVPCLDALGARD